MLLPKKLLLASTLSPLFWTCTLGVLQPYLNLLNNVLPTTKGVVGSVSGAIGVEPTYDYVVVGGGTAGNVLGNRLAEAGHFVAIVEAGGYYEVDNPVISTSPAACVIGVGASPDDRKLSDWGFVTTPQVGAGFREIHYARGKCLGGSSALNAMVYQRGTKDSYDKWAELVQDDSFTWPNILPYFKKSIEFTPPDTSKRFANATTQSNPATFPDKESSGPVQVSYTNYVSPFATWLKAGLEAANITETEDFNSGSLLGSQYSASTINPVDETRSSSEEFIHKAKKGKLDLYLETLVQRVLFNEEKKAIGVHVVPKLIPAFDIHATKEVIVCAGAFQSPQLLMVSGIGPVDTLNQFNIPVLVDLPGVGQNLIDHPFVAPTYQVNCNTLTRLVRDPLYLLDQTLQYTTKHEGMITNAPEVLGWEKIPASHREAFSLDTLNDLSQFPDDWPEVEYIPGNGFIGNFSSPVADQPNDGNQYAAIIGVMVAPTSRGNITIQSTSMDDPPVINPNWLTTKTDMEVAVAMYKRMQEIWATEPMQFITIDNEMYPELNSSASDEDIAQNIRENVMTLWHASATCKMGVRDDPMAVLDSRARVYGVDGLRVVDASSFPLLPPGHPQSSVYMLAEKIADHIVSRTK